MRTLSLSALVLVLASTAMVLVPQAAPATAAARAARATAGGPTYYVSLGDSYSVGYQPGIGATPGYTVYVANHTNLKLVNFGCGGATTTSILDSVGCPDVLPHTTGGVTYPSTTQIAAAEAFLTAHRGHVGLITVSIGGNDVTACATQGNPLTCVAAAAKGITTNVTALAGDLRTAAGPKVPIIGLTYPDVILGGYVYPKNPPAPSVVTLAKASVVAFKLLINPALVQGVRHGVRLVRRLHQGDRRLHLTEPDGEDEAVRDDPRAGRDRLRTHVVLRRGQHPRPDTRLHPGREVDRGPVPADQDALERYRSPRSAWRHGSRPRPG